MVEPRRPDWKETYPDDVDIELDSDNKVMFHARRHIDNNRIQGFFYFEQCARDPSNGSWWPIRRVTFEDGNLKMEDFGKGSRAAIRTAELDAEITDVKLAFYQVTRDILRNWEERRKQYDDARVRKERAE